MSAFICSPAHIATCAKILCETVIDVEGEEESRTEEDIRRALAQANVASVAWRYGPEGKAAYAPMINAVAKAFGAVVDLEPSETNVDRICFGDSSRTIAGYAVECCDAEAIDYTEAEGFKYLSCLEYQSCEHPEWEQSEVREWVRLAKDELANDVVEEVLGEAHGAFDIPWADETESQAETGVAAPGVH